METAQYETWHRTLIDLLVKDKWELSRVTPYPPLLHWYNNGKTPQEAHSLITTKYNQPPKKKYNPRGSTPKTKPLPQKPQLPTNFQTGNHEK